MKKKIPIYLILLVILGVAAVLSCTAIHQFLTHIPINISLDSCITLLKGDAAARRLFYTILGLLLLWWLWIVYASNSGSYKNNLRKIFPGVSTPTASGRGEYGTARWLTRSEQNQIWGKQKISERNPIINYLVVHGYDDMGGKLIHTRWAQLLPKSLRLKLANYNIARVNKFKPPENMDFRVFNNGGLLIGKSKSTCYYINENKHTLIEGATGSGKTRCLVLPSLCVQALSGHSIINNDPKGELYLYTYPFLKRAGIETVVMNFENPTTGNHYNFMQPIIDAINEDDIPKAIDETWTIVSSLVGKPKGEPLWNNGECSMLACGILAVAYDNRRSPEYQNLTNAYHFLGKMCTPVVVGNRLILPLEMYLNEKPDTHPAKALVDIANVAPDKTKGSFFTSALSTLRLFTNPYIYEMTRTTDWSYKTTGDKQRAIFMILPDEKTAYYSIASLFVFQHYQTLVASARKSGGSCNVCVEFNLDELGNFTEMPDFNKMMTVSRSRNIRFNLFLQGNDQLIDIYGKVIAKIITGNCETWVYLQSADSDTLKELSGKLGKYTIKVPGGSSSSSSNSYSASSSYNLTGRELLTSDEIGKLKRPYHLVWCPDGQSIMTLPDISKTIFNNILGLGGEKYNKALMQIRGNRVLKSIKKMTMSDIKLWGIWRQYIPGYAGGEDDYAPEPPLPIKKQNND